MLSSHYKWIALLHLAMLLPIMFLLICIKLHYQLFLLLVSSALFKNEQCQVTLSLSLWNPLKKPDLDRVVVDRSRTGIVKCFNIKLQMWRGISVNFSFESLILICIAIEWWVKRQFQYSPSCTIQYILHLFLMRETSNRAVWFGSDSLISRHLMGVVSVLSYSITPLIPEPRACVINREKLIASFLSGRHDDQC